MNERVNYYHIGVRACLYEDDISGLEEPLAKAGKTLNAVSGLGKRHNGLTNGYLAFVS